jgi:hypothetical protein
MHPWEMLSVGRKTGGQRDERDAREMVRTVRARRNRLIAFVVAGVLVLAVAFGGMILYLGQFQGPTTSATAPGGGAATIVPIGQTVPAVAGSFNGAEPSGGMEDGGLQARRISVTSHNPGAPTTVKVTSRSANGGG